ncbi:MAG: hypothetical protein ACR2PF_01680, partial [Rhizobiaceae bacterium]
MMGKHADRNGWWRLSQVKIANTLNCARSTVQQAIDRLKEAGLVEIHPVISDSGRNSAHFFRVVYDPNAPEKGVPPEVQESRLKIRKFGAERDARIAAPPAASSTAPPAAPGPAPNITTHFNDPLSRNARARSPDGLEKESSNDQKEEDVDKRSSSQEDVE